MQITGTRYYLDGREVYTEIDKVLVGTRLVRIASRYAPDGAFQGHDWFFITDPG